MTKKELQQILESADYVFAYTMLRYPHWYTLRDTWTSDAAFEKAVKGISRYGKKRLWHGRPFIYFDAGKYTYWTMGGKACETMLINRALI